MKKERLLLFMAIASLFFCCFWKPFWSGFIHVNLYLLWHTWNHDLWILFLNKRRACGNGSWYYRLVGMNWCCPPVTKKKDYYHNRKYHLIMFCLFHSTFPYDVQKNYGVGVGHDVADGMASKLCNALFILRNISSVDIPGSRNWSHHVSR